MNKELKTLLQSAIGTSQHIIATIVDIRGFTSFSQTVDSVEAANFLKRVYLRIIEEYFQFACYFKPTGDGLLIVTEYDANSLKEMANEVIEASLRLLEDFPELCKSDPMVYFKTPNQIGIGISRGAACCISSENETLDYAGKAINLASRLTNIARPSGIVFDADFNKNLLSENNLKPFSEESIFNIRGIAENSSIKICFTKQYTIIPSVLKKPTEEPKWVKQTYEDSIGTLKKMLSSDIAVTCLNLAENPCDPSQIRLRISIDRKTPKGLIPFWDLTTESPGVSYQKIGPNSSVEVSLDTLMERLTKHKPKNETKVSYVVYYPVESK